MLSRETKRNTDAGKASEVGKQSKVEKKSETSDQRLWRYTRFFKSSLIGTIMLTARMGGALADQSHWLKTRSGSDNATDLPLAFNQTEFNNLSHWTALEFNPDKMPQADRDRLKELRIIDQDIQHVQQGKYDGETSSQPEESRKKKGRNPLSSKREKMETLRAVMDTLKENPEARPRFEKMLNEKQVRERSLLERASEIPAARTLLSDKQSTCHDPCSDIPASVDCIKQCETIVSSDKSACLDVSMSDVLAKVEPVSGLPAPNQQVRLNYTLSARNNCLQTIKDVTYQVQATGDCTPTTLQFFSANPSSLAPGESAGVKAGQDTSMTASCYDNRGMSPSYSLPSSLSVDIYASGTDSTTNSMVHSQEKIFTVLGPSDSGWAPRCHQKCPPATDTPPSTPPPATGTTSIVFVHGLNGQNPKGSDAGHNCTQYWGDAMDFLRKRGLGDLRTIKFYNRDIDCFNGDETRYSSDLHDVLYKSHCTNYPEGYTRPDGTNPDGTNDESIYHLSCLFSQYLNYNFGRANREVILVGHSMGGIIVRETLYQMQEHAGQSPFPTTIGHVTDAITFNTPHEGINPIGVLSCGGCIQMVEMNEVSGLMSELKIFGRNPQTSGGFTDWTVIGSECDGYVSAVNAIDMHASHVVVYATGSPDISCYDHGRAIHDTSDKQDAYQYYCDTSDPDNFPCGTGYHPRPSGGDKWVYTEGGPRGLLKLYNAVTGRFPAIPSGAERVGSSRRLWMAATLASAWALLRR